MKALYVLVLTIVFHFLSGCKGGCADYDYRSKWGGVWTIRTIYHSQTPQVRDTSFFSGKIKCFGDDLLIIPISSNETMAFHISEDGLLTEPTAYFGHGSFIHNDSLHFSMSYGALGSQAGRIVDACR